MTEYEDKKELDYAKEFKKTMIIIFGSIALGLIAFLIANILLDIFLT